MLFSRALVLNVQREFLVIIAGSLTDSQSGYPDHIFLVVQGQRIRLGQKIKRQWKRSTTT